MDKQFGDEHFWTTYIEDLVDDFAGLELHRERYRRTTVAARVLFWAAMGRFCIETFGEDIPVEIAEELIAEAKALVKVK